MTQEQKHYYAFISHSSEDEKIALWLRDELEGYHIPSTVQQDYHAPKQLKPVFVYQTDLAGLNLKDSLAKSLVDSQYLIIICSPSAAKSGYVNGEVQHFIDTNRADKIVPFIIAGTPYASIKGNADDECFPPALLSLKEQGDELRGISLPEAEEKMGSKKAAVVNVIASMLGVRFDVLWDRYKRRKIRQYCLAAGLALLLCLEGLFIWDYNRPTYRYFADYVDKWGVPEGVNELNKEQQRHRYRVYQFEYRRIPFGEPNAYSWRVAKVAYVNPVHQIQKITNTELKDRYPIQIIEYNRQTGDVSRLVFGDAKGNVLLRHVLSERNGQKACVADFVDAMEQRGAGFIGADLNSLSLGQMDRDQRKSNIVRFVYERDENGYIIRQTYHASNDYNLSRSAVSDKDGIFGRAFVLDSLGRRVSVDYLGLNGERVSTPKGVAGRRYEYDVHGNICKASYVDLQGNLIFNEQQWAFCTDIADEWGNVIEENVYDTNGNWCIGPYGCCKATNTYDNQGHVVEWGFYGMDGQPCLCASGYAKATNVYDKWGNVIEWAYYDIDGQPCISNDGYAKETQKYDKRGNRIEWACYGIDGQRCICKKGYTRLTNRYDRQGDEIEWACYDTKGQLCLCAEGYARTTQTYDERRNVIEWACFDMDGLPCLCKGGYAKKEYRYDERGYLIEYAYYCTDGKLCLCAEGYAKITLTYDNQNNIEAKYFDAEGNTIN